MDVEHLFDECMKETKKDERSVADRIVDEAVAEMRGGAEATRARNEEKAKLKERTNELKRKLKRCTNARNPKCTAANAKAAETRRKYRLEIDELKMRLDDIELEEAGERTNISGTAKQ